MKSGDLRIGHSACAVYCDPIVRNTDFSVVVCIFLLRIMNGIRSISPEYETACAVTVQGDSNEILKIMRLDSSYCL